MVEEGITFPRLYDLATLDARERGQRMQEQAAAVNAAMAKDPRKAVRGLSLEHRRPIRAEDVPAQLRPVRRRSHG